MNFQLLSEFKIKTYNKIILTTSSSKNKIKYSGCLKTKIH